MDTKSLDEMRVKNIQKIVDSFDMDKIVAAIRKGYNSRYHDFETPIWLSDVGSGAAGIYQTIEIVEDFELEFPGVEQEDMYDAEEGVSGKVLSSEFWTFEVENLFDVAAMQLTAALNLPKLSLAFNFNEADCCYALFCHIGG